MDENLYHPEEKRTMAESQHPEMPQTTVVTTRANPGCLVSALWFIFFGWWVGGIAILFAWLFSVTIVGLPLGLFIINNIPMILLLQPPGSQQIIKNMPGEVKIQESGLPQHNFILRALFFVLVGWWWSLIWTILSYVACLTIIGLPLGMLMFRLLPAMTTLKRY
jgi:uncharacterized membrane protein YccF (DUF307 family)